MTSKTTQGLAANLSRFGRRALVAGASAALVPLPNLLEGDAALAAPGDARRVLMGFTPWPYDLTWNALVDTYRFIGTNADIISHHIEEGVPWTEAAADTSFSASFMQDWDQRRRMTSAGCRIFLSLSPLNQSRSGMALYRGSSPQMPLPSAFRGLTFDAPLVKTAYLNYVLRAVAYFTPSVLAIGIEVNELFHNSPAEWPRYVALHRYVFDEVKRRYPTLPVCVTVTLHNLLNTGWSDMAAQQTAVAQLLADASDIALISYYPFLGPIANGQDPTTPLRWMRDFIAKPLAVSECGYPAVEIDLSALRGRVPATPAAQQQFYSTMLNQADADSYRFVVLWTHRDYDALVQKLGSAMPSWGIAWRNCGLLDAAGNTRPSFDAWVAEFARPYASAF